MGKALGKFFSSKLVLAIIGLVFIELVLWFVGPLIAIAGVAPLEAVLARIIAALVVLLLFVAILAIVALRDRKRDQTLTKDIAGAGARATAGAPARDAEVEELSAKLGEALGLLKQSRFAGSAGRRYLYQLPWYVFIGPPGAGKTTALVNSGLNFPLADRLGKGAVKGVGGTRNCDWWFTDQAVLIDTAGRYTTQDSQEEADKASWLGFLKLLKQHRKRQPLNGAIVAIGISDLLFATEDQRTRHAAAIRARIKELYAELGVRLPIYVLLTKADLLAGFVEFFDDLGREDREQVWGMTFDPAKSASETGAIGDFDPEYDGLVARLDDRLLERLHKESDLQRRATVFGFPPQVASFKEIAGKFLTDVFQPNRFEDTILLRGVYLTSGTQDGTPIDRLMGAMAATFGIGRQNLSGFSGQGRSYFLTRLFRDVVFGEAGLVSADPKVERRLRRVRMGAYALAAIVVLAGVGFWTASFLGNSKLIADTEAQAADYTQKAGALQVDRVADPDLGPILPLLAEVRDLPGGYGHRNDDVPLVMGGGLYQGDKLGAEATEAYYRALGGMLLPRMLLRLENQITANPDKAEFLYQALKVYLMLGREGPLDKDLVTSWMSLDWNAQFPGPEGAATRDALAGHLAALLGQPLPQIPLNGDLVDRTRQILARAPLAERAYALIKTNPRVTAIPEWRVSDNAGPAAGRVFIRKSGKSLTEGIPGLYTYEGYYKGFRVALPEIAKMVAAESWVLGPQVKVSDDPASADRLKRDVAQLYLNDFAAQWDQMLGDVTVQPFAGTNQAVQALAILSAPDSPIRAMIVSAAQQTTLSKPPAAPTGIAGAAAQADAAVTAAKSQAEQQLASVLGAGQAKAGSIDDLVGQYTDTHFKALHDLASGPPGAPLPIDAVVASLGDLYKRMAAIGSATDQGSALLNQAGGGSAGATAAIQAGAATLPEPVKAWVGALAKSSSSLTVGGARQQLNGIWTTSIQPFCKSATENRYPIYRDGAAEVTLDDFAKLFGKSGLIDGFYTNNLRPFVDISKNPWQWQKVDNTDLGIPQGVLAQFQRAIAIRDSMFPAGGKPSLSFELVPVDLDAQATQVMVDIDGQTVTYDHGPPRPQRIQWPGPGGSAVRVSFQPSSPGGTISIDGPWSLFRLFDQSNLKSTGRPDRFTVAFTAGGHTATFEIRADSVVNPFSSNQLEQFRCPPAL